MTSRDPVRRAGRGRLDDGTTILWSVAEGTRGRRWRAVDRLGGHVTHFVGVLAGAVGRPARREVAQDRMLVTVGA